MTNIRAGVQTHKFSGTSSSIWLSPRRPIPHPVELSPRAKLQAQEIWAWLARHGAHARLDKTGRIKWKLAGNLPGDIRLAVERYSDSIETFLKLSREEPSDTVLK